VWVAPYYWDDSGNRSDPELTQNDPARAVLAFRSWRGETGLTDLPWHNMPIDLANDETFECFLFGESVHRHKGSGSASVGMWEE
jgi:hypothetical protein